MTLVQEALLGGAVGALIHAIFLAKEKATFFKTTLEHLQSTLQSVGPIMEQISKSEQVPSDIYIRFVHQLEKAKVLVDMYSDIKKWKLLKKRKVKKLIHQMDSSLQRLLTGDFQAQQLLLLTTIDQDVVQLNNKMDHVIALLEGNKDSEETRLEGNKDSAVPKPLMKESLSSPKTNASDAKKSNSTAFELHLKMSKDKCLDIRFWKSRQE